MGGGGTAASALAAPAGTTYTSCPSFSALQSAIGAVGSGMSATFSFAPGLNCVYDTSDPNAANYVTGTIGVQPGATVEIDGNGLTIAGGTASAHGSFDLIAVGDTTSLTLDGTTLEYGIDGIGAALLHAPSLAINNSTITGNTASGINATGAGGSSASIVVTNSTLSDNGYHGINAYGPQSDSFDITVIDSTVSDNGAEGIAAPYNEDEFLDVTVIASTLSRNGSDGIDVQGISPTIDATVTATILADNANSNCSQAVTDGGYNLSASPNGTDTSCGFSGTSHTVTDAQLNLQPLANNGGPTETQALGPGSVAIDAIPVYQGQCTLTAGQADPILDPTTNQPVTTDQRGVLRPQGSGCDIGAYELMPLKLLAGPMTVQHGYFALIRIEALGPDGTNISSRNLIVSAVELDGPNGQVIPFDHQFQFARFGGTPSYQLGINTRNLTPGTWTLQVRIGSGAGAITGTVTFTVE